MRSIIVHYQEIALKGRNRPWFIAHLVRNLRRATHDLDVPHVRSLQGRIELVLGPGVDWEMVKTRVARVFGIANFARAGRAPLDIESLAARVIADLEGTDVASFEISARRADKRFPMTSPEIERMLGARI